MAKYILIVGVLLSAESKLFSQNIESIATDRPDQTETPHTVPKNHFQMETGFSFEQTDKDTKTYAYPAALLKYGLTDRLDLRLVTEFTSEKTSTVNTTGLNPVDIGFKVNLVREKGIIPITSFIGHLGIPSFASKDHKAIYYAPAFRFTMQHTLSRNVDLGYNFGARWDGEGDRASRDDARRHARVHARHGEVAEVMTPCAGRDGPPVSAGHPPDADCLGRQFA